MHCSYIITQPAAAKSPCLPHESLANLCHDFLHRLFIAYIAPSEDLLKSELKKIVEEQPSLFLNNLKKLPQLRFLSRHRAGEALNHLHSPLSDVVSHFEGLDGLFPSQQEGSSFQAVTGSDSHPRSGSCRCEKMNQHDSSTQSGRRFCSVLFTVH